MANSFDHVEAVASTTWTIPHNLNSAAIAIDCYIDNTGTLEKILPLRVERISDNTTEVTFSVVQAGVARIVK